MRVNHMNKHREALRQGRHFPVFVYCLPMFVFVRPVRTAGAGVSSARMLFPHHLKLNNMPKSGLPRKGLTGKPESHMFVKTNCRAVALKDI